MITVSIALLAAAGLWFLWTYNRLIKARNQQAEAWSGVDVQLKKRADLVPSLVECVRGYTAHESGVMLSATRLRTPQDVVGEMKKLFALAEAYPDLKASENFRTLTLQLVAIEDDLQYARRYFNGSVRDFRNLAESFPSNLVAGIFKFQPAEFFEIDNVIDRQNPPVKL